MERSRSKRTCGMIKYVHQILFHHEQVYIQIDIRGWVTVYVLSFTLYLELLAAAFSSRELTARGIEQFDWAKLKKVLNPRLEDFRNCARRSRNRTSDKENVLWISCIYKLSYPKMVNYNLTGFINCKICNIRRNVEWYID